jgi:ABC-type branched-subunit amino acid transport system substrate-binding protein
LYPILSRNHSEYFNKKYKDLFGETPNPLYVYAYDGVALSSALSKVENSDLYQAIEDPEGFMGMNGTFRLFSSGKNEHNLNIVEVTAEGLKTVNTAPLRFNTVPSEEPVVSYETPEIFGLPPETFFSGFPDISSKNKSYFGAF